MLWQSIVPTVLSKLYEDYNSGQESARKADARKRIAYYEDNQVPYIFEELSKYFSEPEKLKICFVNVVKKIVNSLAMVYMQDAKREVEGTDRDKEIFAEIARTTSLSVKWKNINRYCTLLKTLLVRVNFRNGALDLDVITPDIASVRTGTSPEDIIEVIVTHYPESGKSSEVTYSKWDQSTFEKLDYRGQRIESESTPNPYGIIPYQPIWDRCPASSFWLSGGEDLIVIQESINEKLCDLLYTIRHQGFSIGVISGNQTAGGTIQADPGSFIEIGENGSVSYVSAKAPIEEIISAIEFLLAQAAVSNGLSAASLSTKNIDESGIAKVVGTRELEELRRDQIALYSKYEQNLFSLMKTVWNVHNPSRKFSEKSKLLVDFYDSKPSLSPDKQTDMWEKLLNLEVISPVDVAMARNPDLKSREDALAYLIQVKEEIRSLTE